MKMWFMWRHQTHAIFVHNAVKILSLWDFPSVFISLIKWILKPWTRRIECSWRTRWVSIGVTWSSTSWRGASRTGRWTGRRRQRSGRRHSPQPHPRVHWVRLRRRRQPSRRRTTSRRWRERTMQKVCLGKVVLVRPSEIPASLTFPTIPLTRRRRQKWH